ncbi:MAG TPA: HAD family phosphatase [Xanthobacteraceae bacterium]|nr:HAD family phosphatase [Xanthobacteraceae bacterium]
MTADRPAIRFVIFDMDGVLDRYDLSARLEKLAAATGKSAESIHAAIWKSGFEDAADAGKFSAAEYLAGFSERIGAPLSRADWIAARRAAMHPDREVLLLAERLKPRAGIAVLTNNGFLVKDCFDELFPELPPLFGEKLHVAAEFGAKKPDPEVYRRLVARHGVEPASAMMIDDKPENVEGAKAAGLAGHRFTGLAGLRQEFQARGLL